MFEMAQVFEKGEYHPSSEDETLPVHKKYLTGCIVGKDAKSIFYEAKGIIENMAEYCHMENLSFKQNERPSWADVNAYLDIIKTIIEKRFTSVVIPYLPYGNKRLGNMYSYKTGIPIKPVTPVNKTLPNSRFVPLAKFSKVFCSRSLWI